MMSNAGAAFSCKHRLNCWTLRRKETEFNNASASKCFVRNDAPCTGIFARQFDKASRRSGFAVPSLYDGTRIQGTPVRISGSSPRGWGFSVPDARTTVRPLREEIRSRDISVRSSSSGGDSYLSIWAKAKQREREETEREQKERLGEMILGGNQRELPLVDSEEVEERKKREREMNFSKLLQVPETERVAFERQSLIDRANAALVAAKALLNNKASNSLMGTDAERMLLRAKRQNSAVQSSGAGGFTAEGLTIFKSKNKNPFSRDPTLPPSLPSFPSPSTLPQNDGSESDKNLDDDQSRTLGSSAAPGPDFWLWVPPTNPATPRGEKSTTSTVEAQTAGTLPSSLPPLSPSLQPAKKEVTASSAAQFATPFISPLFLEFESSLKEFERPSFLPQSLDLPLEREDASTNPNQSDVIMSQLFASSENMSLVQKAGQDERRSRVVAVASAASPDADVAFLDVSTEASAEVTGTESGTHPDGSRWWKESGLEYDDVSKVRCEWTVIRGVSADGSEEWEEKWWEKYDEFDYKELGAEKSGRNANGKVWREMWREVMWKDLSSGVPHIEKSADKWGRDGTGGEWHEKWNEQYNAKGYAKKWADKWAKIDENTPLYAGHAHVWHETWGEYYDGQGIASKYSDKWAERKEGEGRWSKWGDKWDERFDASGHGYKQGETWWEGEREGERWNRNWSEGHNGSGWVHKKGQSSSGDEYWDVHEPMETWYEKRPHFGFRECMENSRRLREVGKNLKSVKNNETSRDAGDVGVGERSQQQGVLGSGEEGNRGGKGEGGEATEERENQVKKKRPRRNF